MGFYYPTKKKFKDLPPGGVVYNIVNYKNPVFIYCKYNLHITFMYITNENAVLCETFPLFACSFVL